MRRRTPRRVPRTQAPRHTPRKGFAAADATTEPDPGPPPEAVFDRITGPFARRWALGLSSASAPDEEM